MDEAREWADVLGFLTGGGEVPMVGSPRRRTLDAIGDLMRPNRVFDPVELSSPAMPPAVFKTLLTSVAECQEDAYARSGRRILAMPDDVCEVLVGSTMLEELEALAGVPLQARATGTYLYYSAGDSLTAHVDRGDLFEFNYLLCVDRTVPSAGWTSRTYMVDGSHSPLRTFDLRPGSGVLFHASATPHGRTPLCEGSSIKLVSIGLTQAS